MSDDDLPRGDQPGAGSTPFDDGKGTIGLGDRLGDAAPDTNQGKTEPLSPTPDHPEPPERAAPSLDSMNVGSGDPQIAHPTGLPSATGSSAGPGTSTSTDGGPGQARGVPVTAHDAAEGTSEGQHPVS